MPRQARKKSESGIYHVMLRGINRQTIFEDEEDCNVFLKTIAIYKEETSTPYIWLLFNEKSYSFACKK